MIENCFLYSFEEKKSVLQTSELNLPLECRAVTTQNKADPDFCWLFFICEITSKLENR